MEHYIELINGTRIVAFPKAEQPAIITEDRLALDTTGEYLQIGGRKRRKHPAERNPQDVRREQLFLRYAHRLIAMSDTILADSRMFLAPLPIRNGLAYSGTSGFQNPTLGVYIEWWKRYKCSWVLDDAEDENGVEEAAPEPIVYIAGSPLSGANKCAYVTAEGECRGTSVTRFAPVWKSFVAVNTRYTEEKQRYEAYTLEEVISRLFGEEL